MSLVSNLQTSILRTTEKHFIVFGINIESVIFDLSNFSRVVWAGLSLGQDHVYLWGNSLFRNEKSSSKVRTDQGLK